MFYTELTTGQQRNCEKIKGTHMKKLMFAVAAVAAGTVLADVTSGNIVG